jgi:hypothetical protein
MCASWDGVIEGLVTAVPGQVIVAAQIPLVIAQPGVIEPRDIGGGSAGFPSLPRRRHSGGIVFGAQQTFGTTRSITAALP